MSKLFFKYDFYEKYEPKSWKLEAAAFGEVAGLYF